MVLDGGQWAVEMEPHSQCTKLYTQTHTHAQGWMDVPETGAEWEGKKSELHTYVAALFPYQH